MFQHKKMFLKGFWKKPSLPRRRLNAISSVLSISSLLGIFATVNKSHKRVQIIEDKTYEPIWLIQLSFPISAHKGLRPHDHLLPSTRLCHRYRHRRIDPYRHSYPCHPHPLDQTSTTQGSLDDRLVNLLRPVHQHCILVPQQLNRQQQKGLRTKSMFVLLLVTRNVFLLIYFCLN